MGSEWRKVKLEEVASEITVGYVGSMTSEYIESGVPFLRSKNVDPFTINLDDIKYISPEFNEKLKKSALAPGDVVIVRTGKPGTCAVIPDWLESANCSDLVIVRCGPEINNRFLAYYVNTVASSHVNAHLVGAVQQHFNVGSAKLMELSLPTLEVQEKIVSILVALDQKIALNSQINSTLESMAQALFKSWFVDFDPVIDNALAAGSDIPDELQARAARRRALLSANTETAAARLPQDIQQLFPDRFVFTEEMGWVPEEWEVDLLSSYINVKHGFAFKGEYFSDQATDDVLLTPGNVAIGGGYKGDKLKFYEGPVESEYVLKEGDLILTMTDLSKQADTLGYPALVPFDKEKRYLHNQRLGKVELKKEVFGFGWLYYFFCSQAYRDEILSGMSGTTVKHTSPKKIMANKIVTPEKALLQHFEKTVSAFLRKKSLLLQENKTLSNLRDSLLPKLLSGQLSIPEAEQALGAVN